MGWLPTPPRDIGVEGCRRPKPLHSRGGGPGISSVNQEANGSTSHTVSRPLHGPHAEVACILHTYAHEKDMAADLSLRKYRGSITAGPPKFSAKSTVGATETMDVASYRTARHRPGIRLHRSPGFRSNCTPARLAKTGDQGGNNITRTNHTAYCNVNVTPSGSKNKLVYNCL